MPKSQKTKAVSWTALMLAGGASVVAAPIAAYALATADSDRGVALTLIAVVAAAVAFAMTAWAVRDWREATARMESHMPVIRHHAQRLRQGQSDEGRAKKLVEDALQERELLIRAGAYRQATEMTAAIAELEAAMHDDG